MSPLKCGLQAQRVPKAKSWQLSFVICKWDSEVVLYMRYSLFFNVAH